MLQKLNKLQLASIFTGNRLKKFHLLQQFKLDHHQNLDYDKIPFINNLLANDNNKNILDQLMDI